MAVFRAALSTMYCRGVKKWCGFRPIKDSRWHHEGPLNYLFFGDFIVWINGFRLVTGVYRLLLRFRRSEIGKSFCACISLAQTVPRICPGFRAGKQYLLDQFLCFRLSCAPAIFNRILLAIAWFCRQCMNVFPHLDDFSLSERLTFDALLFNNSYYCY